MKQISQQSDLRASIVLKTLKQKSEAHSRYSGTKTRIR